MEQNTMNELLSELKNKEALLFESIGIPVDHSLQSLELIENFINEISPLEFNPGLSAVLPFGYYLGETMIQNFEGAHWNTEVDHPMKLEVVIPKHPNSEEKLVLRPITRVSKFWQDRTDGLAVMYRTVQLMVMDFLDTAMKGIPTGEWKEFANGDRVRLLDPQKHNNQ